MSEVPWLRALDPAAGPLYLQIVAAMEAALASGALRPGDRLPPQRALAQNLGVDLTTVTRAYAEARQRNLLDAVTGRGSFVADVREPAGPAIDLGMNIPPAPLGLRLGELLARGLDEVLARANAHLLMSYHVGAGSMAERAAGASWLRPVLGAVDPERLVVCPGAQAGLAAVLTSLARPGDAVLCDALTYPGFLALATQLDLKVVGLAGDGDGLMPDALERACRAAAPRALYLAPTIHNPTAVTMPEARRREVAAIARRAGVPVLEDDPYALLAGDAPPPLALLAPEGVYYVGTLSKCLTPGLRTAFLLAPSATEAQRMARALRALNQMPAPLMTALVTLWVRDGTAAALLAGVRAEAAERQKLARALLPQTARAHPNGLHVWQPLPRPWDRHRLMDTARRAGLGVSPSDAFHAGGPVPDAVRISLGAVPDRARLASALRQLADIIADPRPAAHDIV